MISAPLRFILAALLTAAFVGCDSDSEDDPIVGRYEATTFDTSVDGNELDVLAAGGSITVTLRSDRTVTGLLSVPAILDEDGDGQYSLDGTYAVDGDVVTFTHEADTFVRNAEWTYADGTLRTQDFGTAIVLERR